MKLEEIRSIAKLHTINPGKLSKTELIRTIQSEEGNFDCFATAYSGECDQVNCIWREDCFDAAQNKGELS
ncbi:MAG: SAP domain-containing protein [Gallionella sp.]